MTTSNSMLRELRVTPPEQAMLKELARRGGEMPWDWGHASLQGPKGEIAKAMIANMINSQLVIERVYAKSAADDGNVYLRLTDRGRDVVEKLEKIAAGAPLIITASA